MKIVSADKNLIEEFQKLFPFTKISMGKWITYNEYKWSPKQTTSYHWKTWKITIRYIKVGHKELKFLKENFTSLAFQNMGGPPNFIKKKMN